MSLVGGDSFLALEEQDGALPPTNSPLPCGKVERRGFITQLLGDVARGARLGTRVSLYTFIGMTS